MKARNQIADKLLEALQREGIEALPGYFGGASYCVGVIVKSPAEAFTLGAKLGPHYGEISFDRAGARVDSAIIVFRDAHVSA